MSKTKNQFNLTSMAKHSSSVYWSLSLLLFLMLSGKACGGCGYLSTIGGGCPNLDECMETCRPCYRGIGRVKAGCVEASGPIVFGECRCYFLDRAPCPPPGPPRCPRMWPRDSAINYTTLNHTLDHS